MPKIGRPTKNINWEQFDQLASFQCTQAEIAAFFDCSISHLEDLCREQRGETLSVYWTKRRFLGKTRLRKAQMNIVEKGGPGAATMAIYLDKKIFPDERPDLPPAPPPVSPSVAAIGTGKKTYVEFCTQSGYFEPFPKQLEMVDFVIKETVIRLLLGARGYGKTDYCTIMGVAYEQYQAYMSGADMSECTNLIVTKAGARAKAIIYEISEALKKNGVELDKDTSTEIRVKGLIGQDHSVEAITIKTSMRGRHPKRLLMDDPVTDEDTSESMRALVKKRYDEAYKLCKNIVIIGQPAHQFDLYAHLRGIIKTMLVPHGTIPELDADLEAMKIAGVDPASIEMSYHLRVPVSGGAPFATIQRIDSMPTKGSVMFIDPSDGGDYTAASCITGYLSGVAVEGKVWKKAWYHCLDGDDGLIAFAKKNRVEKLCFETNMTGKQPLDLLRTKFGPLGIGVAGAHSDTNKHAVIMAAGAFASSIFLSKESDQAYTNQVIQYEYKAKYDDAPDSMARGLEWIGVVRGKR